MLTVEDTMVVNKACGHHVSACDYHYLHLNGINVTSTYCRLRKVLRWKLAGHKDKRPQVDCP